MNLLPDSVVYRGEDRFGKIRVVDTGLTRKLFLGSDAVQSEMAHHDPNLLCLSYTQSMMAALLLHPAPREILMIGLGGGSIAKFLLSHFPDCSVHCIELRAEVVSVAETYFHVPVGKRLQVQVGDAIDMLRHDDCATSYDLAFVDAYDQSGIAPSVATPAFFELCRDHLADSGWVVFNLWSSERDEFQRTLSDIAEVFENEYLQLPVSGKGNVIVFARKGRLPSNKNLKQLRSGADHMQTHLGLDFAGYLAALRRCNKPLLRRIFSYY